MSVIEASIKTLGYCISEPIYAGTRILVYRGERESDNRPVILKLMHKEYPSFHEIIQFRHQYTITKNLDIIGVVAPLSLEPYKNGYLLVMEDIGGISLKEYVKQYPHALPLSEFLPIAIQITAILDEVHRACIIHKDIKPTNILIIAETKQIKLIDFSIASLLPKETQTLKSANFLEGTLAYLSPEQTGRMNRGIDYRSDFYSLGVTFYELLTGQLPFLSNDAMELVHCHIAKQPTPAHRINPNIPEILSEIIHKLMAKNAEERYQSLLGLKHDLEQCLSQFQALGEISSFQLGTRDISDRFIIPEKLYGRQQEVETLLQAFNRVAGVETRHGASLQSKIELMLVAGFSGIGKTAVVNEVHKPIVECRGYFVKGKFDQFQRNIPLSAFVQAFRDLMGQLLSESDTELQQWKSKILSALGENGQVIIEVIPELERIISKQPPVPELAGDAAQNRFNLLFEKFIQVFTTKAHPLVMFLDDLQWADSASLNLMKLLMSKADSGYLLLIGAYRDNEVTKMHPLILTLEELRLAGATINTITLAPLSEADVNHLVADTLKCTPLLAQPLTQLVYQKTQGNPFFATQFLKVLHQDGFITFNPPVSPLNKGGIEGGWGWQCDIARVRDAALTDDVVEFMAIQLQKLPTATQDVLKLAACIGNSFDLATLAIVSEQLQTETAVDLWKALQEGFVIPTSEVYKFYHDGNGSLLTVNCQPLANYKFLHDRVQQAAYSLIPETTKQQTHWRIGQLLLKQFSQQQQEEKLFEIVNQLNMGRSQIQTQSQREQLANLNLKAGQKARSATAYVAGNAYAEVGLGLISCGWQQQYDLMLQLHNLAIELAYLTGNYEQVRQVMQVINANAKTLLHTVNGYDIEIQTYTAQKNYWAAVDTGFSLLKRLGIKLTKKPSNLDLLLSLVQAKLLLHNKKPQRLLHLPTMTSRKALAALRILDAVSPAVYYANRNLLVLLTVIGLRLSVKFGNSPLLSTFCAGYGLLLCSLNQIKLGNQYGELALNLLPRCREKESVPRVLVLMSMMIKPWQSHLRSSLPLLQTAQQVAEEIGDFEFIATSFYASIDTEFCTGRALSEIKSAQEQCIKKFQQLKQDTYLYMTYIGRWTVLKLIYPQSATSIDNIAREYELTRAKYQAEQDTMGLFVIFLSETFVLYLLNDDELALQTTNQMVQYQQAITGHYASSTACFYDALVRLRHYRSTAPSGRKQLLRQVAARQKQMKIWAMHAPMNFQHKFDLMEAERLRVLGQNSLAVEFYDCAIASAKANGYTHEEALANELAARFYLEWGKEKVASVYMQSAYYGYARWGALAKTEDLEKRYSQLLQPILQQEKIYLNPCTTATVVPIHKTVTSSNSSIYDVLDLTSVIKASQALSSEIELEKLLAQLIQVVMENTGAKKAALILPKDNTWVIEAYATITTEPKILESIPLDDCTEIATSAINYVKNTLEKLLLDDASASTKFASDSYIIHVKPKSLLITPIFHQGKLIAILYLENHLTAGVFTSDRLEVIQLLCSQVAISLENARLYHSAQQALEDLKQAQLQLVQSEKMSALGNLVAGVAHEINNPVGFIAGNIQPAFEGVRDLFSLIDLYQKEYPQPTDIILDEIKTIDLEYLRDDLPQLISSINSGVERIFDISNSLRTFSRADTNNKVSFNIHEGLDSTILILKHRLKASEQRPVIEVVKDYGNLPAIKCFPGQLNQVFMNVLANAIDALEQSNTGRSFADIKANPNRITITTRITDDSQQVSISIKDNGVGMTEEVKQKIFDHLYTTKGVGKGTGLGLSIARQIVIDKHGGSIQVNSAPGQGAEFLITIPV